MKNTLQPLLAIVVLATVPSFTTTFEANAVNANFAERKVRMINSEGRRACAALAGSGYKASIVGVIEASGRSGYQNFRIKTCFPSASQCQSFLRNIHHEVGKIDQIRRTSCSPS